MALDWINTVAEVANGVVCTSRTSVDELHQWLVAAEVQRVQPLSLGYFHPGADFHVGRPPTWRQSCRELLDVVLGQHWYLSWPDGTKVHKTCLA